MNILGTGLSGLVGSRVTQILAPDFTFQNLSLETGVNITDKKSIDTFFATSDAPWIFHMAAYTDVQEAEKERGLAEKSTAWKVNVTATENIAANCKQLGKKLLYIDTDYAFDGKKKSYTEEDIPNPLGWYGITKSEGAKRVLALGNMGLVIRISNPYRARPVGLPRRQAGKKDFVHKMLESMQTGQTVKAPSDQIFTPTFIDDIAAALRVLVRLGASGIYHVVGSPISPYEAAGVIAEIFGYDKALVQKTSFAAMFNNRAPIPRYAALKNDKIKFLGVIMHSFVQGIAKIKEQEAL
jgi:dTDP-4-dehydrorhamnose reductase